jgi:hypothetical protein
MCRRICKKNVQKNVQKIVQKNVQKYMQKYVLCSMTDELTLSHFIIRSCIYDAVLLSDVYNDLLKLAILRA